MTLIINLPVMPSGKISIEMKTRLSFREKEAVCQQKFSNLKNIYHACTPENHPVIFITEEDFKTAITLLGICLHRYGQLRLLTFELMSNHLHLVIIGEKSDISDMFEEYKALLHKCILNDRSRSQLKDFSLKLHEINDLENLRNVIAYVNRNGSVIDENHSPFSYPWGANRFYFNPEAICRHMTQKRQLRVLECRTITRSRKYDDVGSLFSVDGCLSPVSFCEITKGEEFFRDARQYFFKISRNIESYEQIARIIGENIYYSDSDLFQIACRLSQNEFNCRLPHMLAKDAKIKLAKTLHYEYNAGIKQVQRMLKIDMYTLKAIFGSTL